MEQYDPKRIEPKWQNFWAEKGLYKAQDFSKKPKQYSLVEFPYPSGAGLHVGHLRSYTALDIVSRKLRMQGYNVLYPIGWDAFGLPTENYAIKNKIHPRIATEQNINTFKKQLKSLGLSYDWSREINTTEPKYYKWTQWIFLKLFEKNLAYKKKLLVNWCPSCKIVLANEEVVNDKCERCGTQVVKKEKEQWLLAITKYADRLIEDLKAVDYLEKIKVQQINWIGRSEGAQFAMKVKNSNEKVEVYTTRLDTIFGMTYAVVAPEHAIIGKLEDKIKNYAEVKKYIIAAQSKTDLERTELQKEKTGVELKGIKIINPFNHEELPLYVADYVLGFYGTGAVMAVPAHDERDLEFAKKYGLPIKKVIEPCFLQLTEPGKIRDGKPFVERDALTILVKHWEKDEYLGLKWKKVVWHTFVTGGVEEGQTPEEAARMEILEETGYKNIKLIKELPMVHSQFYHVPKKVNRFAHSHVFYFQLEDGERAAVSAEEKGNHEIVWVPKDKIEQFLTVDSHKYIWRTLGRPGVAYTDDGVLNNSGEYNFLTSPEAREKMTKRLEKAGIGGKKINYKLRDWIFSRQHYWGEPIPVVHCEKCGIVPVPEKDLPVELPEVESYEPTDTGESPLAKITDWVSVKCPQCGGEGQRETDTMPNWAGSSWYFLRYADPDNDQALADPEKLKYWMPVDLYNGGMEHTTLHLLYSRFWNKFLFDIGVSPVSEPYARRRSHGMVLAEDGKKMSKSLGNVVNPDQVVEEVGADSLRLYEMFMGPFEDAIPWSTTSVSGVRRFLDRVWEYPETIKRDETGEFTFENWVNGKWSCTDDKVSILLNKTIKKVTEDIENFRFNTAISQMMILRNAFYEIIEGDTNNIYKTRSESTISHQISKKDFEKFLIILSPFAPHIAEELWEKLGHTESIFLQKWPDYDPELIKDKKINLVIQINGKVRGSIEVSAEITEEEMKDLALRNEKIKPWIKGKEIKKTIFVQGKLINLVI